MSRSRPHLLTALTAGLAWTLLASSCSVTSQEVQDVETTQQPKVPATTSSSSPIASESEAIPKPVDKVAGAQALADSNFSILADRNVGLIANQTSLINSGHLADALATADSVNLVALFAPEHGLRGKILAGDRVEDTTDEATGLEVFSLYGQTRKPTSEMLDGIDVLVFDIQDVGARFYTFISTMGFAMQAAAEANIEFVVLDRPNPQGGLKVSGFTRTPELESFVGQYPIPSTYGLTAGELAVAIKGEGWLPNLESLDLTVVPLSGWTRDMTWTDWTSDWIAPSPALPTVESAMAYPGVVLFEATDLEYGRGSDAPFLRITGEGIDGQALASQLNDLDLSGVTFDPELSGIRYVVTDPKTFEPVSTGVHVLKAFHDTRPTPIIDRPGVFDLLAGNTKLREMLETNATAEEIIDAWSEDVAAFQQLRAKYLLY